MSVRTVFGVRWTMYEYERGKKTRRNYFFVAVSKERQRLNYETFKNAFAPLTVHNHSVCCCRLGAGRDEVRGFDAISLPGRCIQLFCTLFARCARIRS